MGVEEEEDMALFVKVLYLFIPRAWTGRASCWRDERDID